MKACLNGPFPDLVEDKEEEEDSNPTPPYTPDNPGLEKGDHLWATRLLPKEEYIGATSTISQRLAKAFQKNSKPSSLEKYVPDYVHDFHSVFSKQSFDNLLEPKPWDHAIELIPDSPPKNCKVYPLAVSEQKELDAFLKENLDSG